MYSNSASDYITLKKNQNLQNIFNRKYASNNTMALQINTLRNTCALNDDGNDVPSTWFNVPMTSNYTNCNNAQIIVKNPTMPYMSRLPHMTIEPVMFPIFAGRNFRLNIKSWAINVILYKNISA